MSKDWFKRLGDRKSKGAEDMSRQNVAYSVQFILLFNSCNKNFCGTNFSRSMSHKVQRCPFWSKLWRKNVSKARAPWIFVCAIVQRFCATTSRMGSWVEPIRRKKTPLCSCSNNMRYVSGHCDFCPAKCLLDNVVTYPFECSTHDFAPGKCRVYSRN